MAIDVAAAVVEAGADGEADVPRAAIGDVALRETEIAPVERLLDELVGVVLMIVKAVLRFEADALEIRSMMKLTTPATASAPYTDEAPPVSTSTRSIMNAGITLMSGAGVTGRPAAGDGR